MPNDLRSRRLAFLRSLFAAPTEIAPPPAEVDGVLGPGAEGYIEPSLDQRAAAGDFIPTAYAQQLRAQPDRPLMGEEYPAAIAAAPPEQRAAAGRIPTTSRDMAMEAALRDQIRSAPAAMRNASFEDPNFWKMQTPSRPKAEPLPTSGYVVGLRGADRDQAIRDAVAQIESERPATVAGMTPARFRLAMQMDPDATKAMLAELSDARRIDASERQARNDNASRERLNAADILARREEGRLGRENQFAIAELESGARANAALQDAIREEIKLDPELGALAANRANMSAADYKKEDTRLRAQARQRAYDQFNGVAPATATEEAQQATKGTGESSAADTWVPPADAGEASKYFNDAILSANLTRFDPKIDKRGEWDIYNAVANRIGTADEVDENTLEELRRLIVAGRKGKTGFSDEGVFGKTTQAQWVRRALLTQPPGKRVAAIRAARNEFRSR